MDARSNIFDKIELIQFIHIILNDILYDITKSTGPIFLFRCYKINEEKFKKIFLLRVTVLELEQISDLFLQAMYVFVNYIGACKILLYYFGHF